MIISVGLLIRSLSMLPAVVVSKPGLQEGLPLLAIIRSGNAL